MLETRIICETCGREAPAQDADRDPVWGKLIRPTKPDRDVCPACIARLEGWAEHPRSELYSVPPANAASR